MTRTAVHHLGRAGDVPGGMTQVINGYLGWDFPDVAVAVITTRGDPHDHRAAVALAVRAALQVVRLPRDAVVVAHVSERGSFLREGSLLRLARARGLGTVAHLHGASFAAFAARAPRLVRWTLGAADRVISLAEESSAIARRFVPADHVVLVPNAIPAGAPGDKQDTVVFGGVVSHRKGVDVLLAAWERIAERDGWRLLVAGPVRDAEVVRRDLPGVELLGAVPHERLMGLLDSARVAVLPSRDEAMPMFVLEAMARRTCVIATTVGGIPPVLADGRGLLVAPGDVHDLAGALRTAMTDPAVREAAAGAALSAFHTAYSADAVFPRLQEVWLEALRAARTRREVRGQRRSSRSGAASG